MSLRSTFNPIGGKPPILPFGYKQLECVDQNYQGDLTNDQNYSVAASFSTGIVANATTTIIFSVYPNQKPVWGTFFGAETGDDSPDRWKFRHFPDTFPAGRFQLPAVDRYGFSLPIGSKNEYEIGNFYVKLNGNTIMNSTKSSFSSDPVLPLFLGSENLNGKYWRNCDAKWYSAKIYQNGMLTRNYIPALRISDSIAGLYDISGGTGFRRSETGIDFLTGTGR
jgi:hypothetical protein